MLIRRRISVFRIQTSVQKTLGKMAKRKKYSWHWSSEKLSMSDVARIKLYLSSLDFELQYWNLERMHRDMSFHRAKFSKVPDPTADSSKAVRV